MTVPVAIRIIDRVKCHGIGANPERMTILAILTISTVGISRIGSASIRTVGSVFTVHHNYMLDSYRGIFAEVAGVAT